MDNSTRQPSVRGTVIATILVTVPWLVLVVQFLFVIPRLKRTYDEYGLQLPQLTKTVIATGNYFTHSWWIAIPSALAVMVLMVVFIAWLRHFLRRPAIVPTALVLAGMVAANVVVAYALFLPTVKLAEGLSK